MISDADVLAGVKQEGIKEMVAVSYNFHKYLQSLR